MKISIIFNLTVVIFIGGILTSVSAEITSSTAATAIFHDDPQHLWNRLYGGIFARIGPNKRMYGLDEPDPLLWSNTKYLLNEGSSNTLLLLDEFLRDDGADLVVDTVKRAVLQSDLWSVFDWLALQNAHPVPSHQAASNEIFAKSLAQVIASLRVPIDELKSLPDTYGDAVESGFYSSEYNADQPHQPWLPPDLLQETGSWVNVGSGRDLIGEAHTSFSAGRSVFLVLIRLPGGRASTLAYLDKINNYPNPWIVNTEYSGRNSSMHPIGLNPDLPEFPIGTQVALVRRMVVVGDDNQLHPTNIVQSVQFRVLRSTDENDDSKQSGYEFRISRRNLFSDSPGSALIAVSANERDWGLFRGHGIDPFENHSSTFQSPPKFTVLQSCRACHSPGIMGVQSYTRMSTGARPSAPELSPQSFKAIEEKTIRWKQGQYDWGLLRGLMK